MAKWSQESDQPQELRDLLTKVRKRKSASEASQKPFIDKCNTYYGLYRNYRKLVNARGAENDRDVVEDAKRMWGAELFIPYCFATVETLVPRVLANDPTMLVKPRDDAARSSVEGIAKLYKQRQAEIGYALKLQPIARSGFKYGLGVQKTYWQDDKRPRKRMERGFTGRLVEKEFTETYSEGPQVEDISVFDFFWDPGARSMETCEYAIHRSRRSWDYVKKMLTSGAWSGNSVRSRGVKSYGNKLDLEKVEGMGSDQSMHDQERAHLESAGFRGQMPGDKGRMHEVWEYHDCEQIVTILDRAFVVLVQPQPYFHGELPFQIFRPTIQEQEFPGIGAIEPIAHLQYELNTLRSQRRDAATLSLMKSFFVQEGRLEDEDFIVGPGELIKVLGNPRDILQPIEFGEVPGSSYTEEEAIKADIERATGVSDSLAGGAEQTGTDTATGIQLVQSAAGVRIAQQTKNLEAETITPAARQWLWLWRQHTFNPRSLRIEDSEELSGYRFEEVGPDDLMANVDVEPTSGSTEPENLPQKRNDAMVVQNQFAGSEHVDQRKLTLETLKAFDVSDPESLLTPPQPMLDPNLVGAALVDNGILDDEGALALVQRMLQQASGVQPPPNGERPEGPVQEEPASPVEE